MRFSAKESEVALALEINVRTFLNWRKKYLVEGVHWVRINRKHVRYDLNLILHWYQHVHLPKVHEAEIKRTLDFEHQEVEATLRIIAFEKKEA